MPEISDEHLTVDRRKRPIWAVRLGTREYDLGSMGKSLILVSATFGVFMGCMAGAMQLFGKKVIDQNEVSITEVKEATDRNYVVTTALEARVSNVERLIEVLGFRECQRMERAGELLPRVCIEILRTGAQP